MSATSFLLCAVVLACVSGTVNALSRPSLLVFQGSSAVLTSSVSITAGTALTFQIADNGGECSTAPCTWAFNFSAAGTHAVDALASSQSHAKTFSVPGTYLCDSTVEQSGSQSPPSAPPYRVTVLEAPEGTLAVATRVTTVGLTVTATGGHVAGGAPPYKMRFFAGGSEVAFRVGVPAGGSATVAFTVSAANPALRPYLVITDGAGATSVRIYDGTVTVNPRPAVAFTVTPADTDAFMPLSLSAEVWGGTPPVVMTWRLVYANGTVVATLPPRSGLAPPTSAPGVVLAATATLNVSLAAPVAMRLEGSATDALGSTAPSPAAAAFTLHPFPTASATAPATASAVTGAPAGVAVAVTGGVGPHAVSVRLTASSLPAVDLNGSSLPADGTATLAFTATAGMLRGGRPTLWSAGAWAADAAGAVAVAAPAAVLVCGRPEVYVSASPAEVAVGGTLRVEVRVVGCPPFHVNVTVAGPLGSGHVTHLFTTWEEWVARSVTLPAGDVIADSSPRYTASAAATDGHGVSSATAAFSPPFTLLPAPTVAAAAVAPALASVGARVVLSTAAPVAGGAPPYTCAWTVAGADGVVVAATAASPPSPTSPSLALVIPPAARPHGLPSADSAVLRVTVQCTDASGAATAVPPPVPLTVAARPSLLLSAVPAETVGGGRVLLRLASVAGGVVPLEAVAVVRTADGAAVAGAEAAAVTPLPGRGDATVRFTMPAVLPGAAVPAGAADVAVHVVVRDGAGAESAAAVAPVRVHAAAAVTAAWAWAAAGGTVVDVGGPVVVGASHTGGVPGPRTFSFVFVRSEATADAPLHTVTVVSTNTTVSVSHTAPPALLDDGARSSVVIIASVRDHVSNMPSAAYVAGNITVLPAPSATTGPASVKKDTPAAAQTVEVVTHDSTAMLIAGLAMGACCLTCVVLSAVVAVCRARSRSRTRYATKVEADGGGDWGLAPGYDAAYDTGYTATNGALEGSSGALQPGMVGCDACGGAEAEVVCEDERRRMCRPCSLSWHAGASRAHHSVVPLPPSSTAKPGGELLCDECMEAAAAVRCSNEGMNFCRGCADTLHRRPKRAHHVLSELGGDGTAAAGDGGKKEGGGTREGMKETGGELKVPSATPTTPVSASGGEGAEGRGWEPGRFPALPGGRIGSWPGSSNMSESDSSLAPLPNFEPVSPTARSHHPPLPPPTSSGGRLPPVRTRVPTPHTPLAPLTPLNPPPPAPPSSSSRTPHRRSAESEE